MITKRIKQNKTGASIVEMLVVISILVTMSAAMFLGVRSVGGVQKLAMSTQQLASDIRLMQSNVLNLRDFNGTFPDGGWGVFINKATSTNYIMFADLDDVDYMNGDNSTYDQSTETYRTVEMTGGVEIKEILVDDAPVNSFLVAYIPPEPLVNICDDAGICGYNKVEITLANFDNDPKIIEINKYGLIDIQN